MGNTLGAALGDAVGFTLDEQKDAVGFTLVDGQQRDFVGSAYVDEE